MRPVPVSLSHVAARQELRSLIQALGLAGTAEPAGWVRQSQDLVSAIVDQGLAVGYHPRPGRNHYSIVEELAAADGYIARLVGRDAQA